VDWSNAPPFAFYLELRKTARERSRNLQEGTRRAEGLATRPSRFGLTCCMAEAIVCLIPRCNPYGCAFSTRKRSLGAMESSGSSWGLAPLTYNRLQRALPSPTEERPGHSHPWWGWSGSNRLPSIRRRHGTEILGTARQSGPQNCFSHSDPWLTGLCSCLLILLDLM